MRLSRRRTKRGERGSAVVEFAIISTILVPLMMYSMYFVDLARARIKTSEIARYAVWEMTSYPLSEYRDKNHQSLYQAAVTGIAGDIANRYGDDLRSDTLGGTQGGFITADFQLQQVQFQNLEAKMVPNLETYESVMPGGVSLGPIANMVNQIGGYINDVFGFWGFNKNGMIRATVTLQFSNNFVPRENAQEFFNHKLFPDNISQLNLTENYQMLVDAWTLLDGENVYAPGGYSKNETDSLFYQQVDRMVWMGLFKLPLIGNLTDLMRGLQKVPVLNNLLDPCPQCPRVVSIASRGDEPKDANDIIVNVDCGEKQFHTTPIRDRQLSPKNSEYGKTYMKRGDWYMGCKKAQQLKCEYK